MVLVQKLLFFQLFVLGNIVYENVSYEILEQEKDFLGYIKTRSLKSGKVDIFPKGLTHGCGRKMPGFLTFLFRQ